MDSTAFEYLCEALETRSTLDRLEARGTVRLALKKAGLDARSVTPEQASIVVQKLLPAELDSRGLSDVASVCNQLARDLAGLDGAPPGPSTAEDVFSRLGTD